MYIRSYIQTQTHDTVAIHVYAVIKSDTCTVYKSRITGSC